MKEFTAKFVFLFIATFISVSHVSLAQDLAKQLDPIFQKEYPSNGPGAVVLVAKNGKILYRNAFGKANLELDVPMKPENVFELGSITKQFTAVAILQLMEQGKLSLEDSLSKYITDYPRGNEIKIHPFKSYLGDKKLY